MRFWSDLCECMRVNGEALQLCAVYKELYFLLQVTRESVSVLQVMHAASECAMKLKGLYVNHSTKLYRKNITRLLPLALLLMLRTHNNTNGNKLVIFSTIALYYGDTYTLSYLWILQHTCVYYSICIVYIT